MSEILFVVDNAIPPTKLDRNDIFREMALIDKMPRASMVRALEDCSISVMK